jgi:hypothetical protein
VVVVKGQGIGAQPLILLLAARSHGFRVERRRGNHEAIRGFEEGGLARTIPFQDQRGLTGLERGQREGRECGEICISNEIANRVDRRQRDQIQKKQSATA